MSMITYSKSKYLVLGLSAMLATVSCSKKDSDATTVVDNTPGKYILAGSGESALYFITANSLDTGTATIVNNGYPSTVSYSHYALNGTKEMVAVNYGGGGATTGTGFSLNASGEVQEVGNGFSLPNGFVTVGSVGDMIITIGKSSAQTDGSVSFPIYIIDANNNNQVTSKVLNTNNLFNGRAVSSLVGVADAGNGQFYTGVQLSGGNADSVYVIKVDTSMNIIAKYQDNRLSYSGAAWRSARYSQIGNDDDGNTYVFSSGYSPSTKPSGALRINKGASTFDATYSFDIAALSGGYQIRRLWHANGDYFLLEIFNTTNAGNSTAGTQFAIVDVKAKTFAWVTGLPAKEDIYVNAQSGATSVGWPFYDTKTSKFYITLKDNNADYPQVYSVNLSTAVAKPGVKLVGATTIPAIGYLTY